MSEKSVGDSQYLRSSALDGLGIGQKGTHELAAMLMSDSRPIVFFPAVLSAIATVHSDQSQLYLIGDATEGSECADSIGGKHQYDKTKRAYGVIGDSALPPDHGIGRNSLAAK